MHVKDIKIFLKKNKIKSKVNKKTLQSHSITFQFLTIRVKRNAAQGNLPRLVKNSLNISIMRCSGECSFPLLFSKYKIIYNFFPTGSGCTAVFLFTCWDFFTFSANVKVEWHLKLLFSQYIKSHREEKERLVTIKARVTDF